MNNLAFIMTISVCANFCYAQKNIPFHFNYSISDTTKNIKTEIPPLSSDYVYYNNSFLKKSIDDEDDIENITEREKIKFVTLGLRVTAFF